MKGCGNPYGWCPHRKNLDEWQACIPCETKRNERQAKIRKEHGTDCTCYSCDWDDYWRHLGKQ